MNWWVKITKEVNRRIGSWGLPRSLLVQVLVRLHHDLPSNPDFHLGPRLIPQANFLMKFALPDPAGIGTHVFQFHVDRNDQSRRLYVVSAEHETKP